ncbi:MAG: response regulator [Campylobacterota bacterium]
MSNIKSLKELAKDFSLLYVEDDVDLRISTIEIFQGLFKYVESAVDGEDGLSKYYDYATQNNMNFDIVVTDIQMPKMNGIELIKEIFTINKDQKILVISAYDDKRYLIELINMGVTGFIQKPLSSKQIVEILLETCIKLAQEQEKFRFIELYDNYTWDSKYSTLLKDNVEVSLTDNERKLFKLLTSSLNEKFSSLEIFEYIYSETGKEYSADVIKSMFKRLRKKIPHELIINTPQTGYSLNS